MSRVYKNVCVHTRVVYINMCVCTYMSRMDRFWSYSCLANKNLLISAYAQKQIYPNS
jgi:hypothetical protein